MDLNFVLISEVQHIKHLTKIRDKLMDLLVLISC
jgi:hypothetical protein